MITALMIWHTGRTISLNPPKYWIPTSPTAALTLTWLPRVLGALVILSLAFGLWNASGAVDEENLPYIIYRLRFLAGITFILSAAFLLFTIFRHGMVSKLFKPGPTFLFSKFVTYAVSIILALLFMAILAWPVSAPQKIGTNLLISIFLLVTMYVGSSLSYYSDHYRLPFLSCAVGLAVVFSLFDLNDNHEIRRKSGVNYAPLPMASAEISNWLAARKDLRNFRGRKFPVYIVAAQGGGMYAAYHAAITLARLQDRCPKFSQHVLAISGVSGGSLGAAVFSVLAAHTATNDSNLPCGIDLPSQGEFEHFIRQFLKEDFLSPVLAGMLFKDALQLFLPFAIPGLDRARAFEASIERAWNAQKPLTRPGAVAYSFADQFRQHWQSNEASPALVLNTTQVESGKRITVMPFAFEVNDNATVVSPFHKLIDSADVRMSTAVALSARFPLITPPGSVAVGSPGVKVKTRLVDGGYFENSGSATALDLYYELKKVLDSSAVKKWLQVENIEIVPILIQIGTQLGSETSFMGLNEFSSPLTAMLRTREARGRMAVEHIKREMGSVNSSQRFSGQFREFKLNAADFFLPLGWYLSNSTQESIRDLSGRRTLDCKDSETPVLRNTQWNDCTVKAILDDLKS